MEFAAGDVGREIVAVVYGIEYRARVAHVAGSRVTLDLRRRSTDPPIAAPTTQATVPFAAVSSWGPVTPGADIAWTADDGPVRGALRDVRGGRGRFRGR